nr:hypothetical protein GCM10017745_45310 [Saccharothrix mutabilis subsp. capreolus]
MVDIKHANRGDLKLDLIAPDGSVYLLEDIPDSDTGDNVQATYVVDATGETPTGGWSLRAQDTAAGTTGTIDSWSLTFTP